MKRSSASVTAIALSTAMSIVVPPAVADVDEAEVAKQTQNPVADLISLPLKFDYNSNLGPTEAGNQTVLTIEPVIPLHISTDWNLISRTLLPVIREQNVPQGSSTQQGLGDTTQQFYFSPKKPTDSGWIWGVGPQFQLPTGGNMFTAGEWGAGPAAVVLKQENGWTFGALVNQMWSVSRDSQRSGYSNFFTQPFLAHTSKTYTTVSINTESTYDWKSRQWSVPINLDVAQILKIGTQLLSLEAGVRYWVDTPDGVGPKNVGFRITLTLLFPESK
jgi:hypothetical protein